MNNSNNPLVSIHCMTFNHKPYIRQCLDGFVMQKTEFPFLAVVVDDASTDGEQEVLWDFINNELDTTSLQKDETDDFVRVVASHKTNEKCSFVFIFLKYNHYSIKKSKVPYFEKWEDSAKYMALCEGDDYWTDPYKLQKQVFFLEKHKDYSCCCHRFKIYYEDTGLWTDDYVGNTFTKHPNEEGLEVDNLENMKTRFTYTLTLCYRKSAFEAIEWPPYKFGRRDIFLHYNLLKKGKGWCFADYMAVYRINNGGIWSTEASSIKGAKTRLDCYNDLYKYHHNDDVVKDGYTYWLNKFYTEYVLPPFYKREWDYNKIKTLCYYSNHRWCLKEYLTTIKHFAKCIALLLGIRKAILWKK